QSRTKKLSVCETPESVGCKQAGLFSAVLLFRFSKREIVLLQLEEESLVAPERSIERLRLLFQHFVVGAHGPAQPRSGFGTFGLKLQIAADGGGHIDGPRVASRGNLFETIERP